MNLYKASQGLPQSVSWVLTQYLIPDLFPICLGLLNAFAHLHIFTYEFFSENLYSQSLSM